MDASTILQAINAAKVAIDTAVKVKNNFFDHTSTSNTSSPAASTSTTVETLQTEIDTQKRRLIEVTTEVSENRTIIQEQNEIIIGLSNALKITAESVHRQRIINLTLAVVSLLSVLLSLYALFR